MSEKKTFQKRPRVNKYIFSPPSSPPISPLSLASSPSSLPSSPLKEETKRFYDGIPNPILTKEKFKVPFDVNSIKLFNPKDEPYGPLGNNSRHIMEINEERYQTVTNYIYSNVLIASNTQKKLVKNSPIKEVKDNFYFFYQDTINKTLLTSLKKGLIEKFKDPNLIEALLSTGNSPIIYISNNSFLGLGVNNDGKNNFGKELEQLRHQIRVSLKREKKDTEQLKKDNIIYNAYLADKALVEILREGNDLQDFMGLSLEDIIKNKSLKNIIKRSPSKEIVLQFYKQNLDFSPMAILAIKHPELLVPYIRKEKFRELRKRQLRKRKEIIFDMYIDYIIKKNFPDLSTFKYQDAKNQQLDGIGWSNKIELQDRITYLFEAHMLSDSLSDNIDKQILEITIPTEEQVLNAESFNEKLVDDIVEEQFEQTYEATSGNPIYIYKDTSKGDDKYKGFLPENFTVMLEIEKYFYPTVAHFSLVNLLALLPVIKTFEQAYLYIIDPSKITNFRNNQLDIGNYLSPMDVYKKYTLERDLIYSNSMRYYTKLALDKKFEDRILQDLLLSTGTRKIIWADFSDPILGEHGRPNNVVGENFAGTYLMALRTHIQKQRSQETIKEVTQEDVSFVINQNPFMKNWLIMKVRDMCKIINIMKTYLQKTDNITQEINPVFVTVVLDKVYQPCSHLFGLAKDVQSETPEYFTNIVHNCQGFSKVSNDVVMILWKRLVVMIHFLIQYIEQSTMKNIINALVNIESLVSKPTTCRPIIDNKEDNCIISAILNLVQGIKNFDTKLAENSVITEFDIIIATCIILNKDLPDKILEPEFNYKNWRKDKIKNVDKKVHKQDVEPDEQFEDLKYIEDEDEDDEFKEFMDDQDEDLDSKEFLNIIEEDEDEEDEQDEEFKQQLMYELSLIGKVKNEINLLNVIINSLEIIKTYKQISERVKINRINFFATVR
jgi:predicted NAD-dependent protein-ADP-ribosyltransferase YbiA (DUF1768 family)